MPKGSFNAYFASKEALGAELRARVEKSRAAFDAFMSVAFTKVPV
jgi:AcrR family transcriptional regulator